MRLIVGLGNVGRQYENTPHNIGFDVVDELARRYNASWSLERRFEAFTATVAVPGTPRAVTLLKPTTFMNLSGKAVAAWVAKNGGEPSEILPVSDDVHLPLGKLRIRPNGSHGGQKGLLSIMQVLGTLDFPRLRLGVTPPGADLSNLPAFVLGSVKPAHREAFARAIEDGADALELLLTKGLDPAMNQVNRAKG